MSQEKRITGYTVEELLSDDLKWLEPLQPKGWGPIEDEFSNYIKHNFCYPVKVESGSLIIGIGAAISFGRSSWIAHIIVHSEYRNQGIGRQIVEHLLQLLIRLSAKSFLLIATEIGKPVYLRAGFRIVTPYVFMQRERPWDNSQVPENIIPYSPDHYNTIMSLDYMATGEDREQLLKGKTDQALLFYENGEAEGYYLPGLCDGPIIALTRRAGIELMKFKYSTIDKAVIPADNMIGIEFLISNGFKITETKGTRMVMGEGIDWKPDMIFSRIGGNYG